MPSCSFRFLWLCLAALVATSAQSFQDPVDVPAALSDRVLRSPLIAVAMAGERLVAVGQRGHVALSDDGGRHWRQAPVPVSVDLVDVSFADARHGWAVGHGGVILHSADGGETWQRQLDGRQTIELILDHYREGDGAGLEQAALYVEREEILVSYGGTQPLMAVHFLTPQHGFVGGLFNRLLETRDGGQTWVPAQHRIDNEGELHFYGIEADADALYLSGEMGTVWRKRHDEEHFQELATGYDGTLFGLASNGDDLVAYGMRGSVFHSRDQGESWVRVPLESRAGITSGVFLADGSLLLGTLSGELVRGTLESGHLLPLPLQRSMPYFGLVARHDGRLTLVGAAGVQHEQVAVSSSMRSMDQAVVSHLGSKRK